MSGWIIETLVATTLLMLLVLGLRGPVASLFGPRAAYLLWLAPALRMVLPPLPISFLPTAFLPASALPEGLPTVSDVAVVLSGPSSLPASTTVATGGSALLPLATLGLWLGGAALFFILHLVAYHRFVRRIRAHANPLFEEGGIRVAASGGVASPIAFGILARAIIVPADFLHRFDKTEQRLALAHETVHHKRGDLMVNMAALAVLALHWWNPIAHFAHRAFRLDQEAACDDLVLAGACRDERAAYGSALYKSATGGVPLVACAMGTTSQLKARLKRIVNQRPGQTAYGAGRGLALMLAAGGVIATASGVALVSEPVIAETPRMIALGGVVINTSADKGRADAQEKAPTKARAAVSLNRAVASVPKPPVAPLPPAAPVEPEAPPAPPTVAALAPRCGDGAPVHIVSRGMVQDGVTHRSVAIVMCHRDDAKMADQNPPMDDAIAALQRTRSELQDDPMLTGELKAGLVAAIDRHIMRLSGNVSSRAPYPAS